MSLRCKEKGEKIILPSMTTLILIRHAKPADPHEYASDFERPLVPEGEAVQRKMAERLRAAGYRPDRILTSPAVRARQTADILGEVLGCVVTELEALGSGFDSDAILAAVGEETALLVGHVPTMPQLVNLFVGEAAFGGMEKSSAAIITFDGQPAFGTGTLVDYLVPN